MFRIATKGCKGWQTVIGLLNTIHDEATVHLTPEGIDFRCMDLSKIALLDFSWNKSNFSIYDCKEEQKIGVAVGDLKVMLDRAKNENIELIHNDGGNMSIIMGSTKKYDFPLIHTADQPPHIKTQYASTNTFNLLELQNSLEDIKIIDDHIVLTMDKGSFKIEAQGQYTKNKGSSIITNEDIVVKEKGEGKFQVDFLLNLIKSVKGVTDKADISLENNKPLRFLFDIKDMGKLKYYIAPIQQ